MLFRCSSCGREERAAGAPWRCPACGGLWDLAGAPGPVDPLVTMGEGRTPLLPLRGGGPLVKLEFAMPTLSFKDRGAVVLVSALAAEGVERVVVDSSGNAGTAIAAYAARAGMACDVFVPAATSPAKLAQAAAHGATVHRVDGDRAAAATAAQEAVAATGAAYASHVYDPRFLHGTKTFAHEVYETLGGVPEVVVLPAGNGTLVLGAAIGFGDLVASGRVERLPRIVAVQAERCAPVAAAFAAGLDDVPPVVDGGTVAEGIAIAAPPRGPQVLAAVRASGGEVVTVSDDEVTAARAALARRGLYVEPTAAAPYAAWLRHVGDPAAVVPLCGAGIKSP